jgi:hypothetical protein
MAFAITIAFAIAAVAVVVVVVTNPSLPSQPQLPPFLLLPLLSSWLLSVWVGYGRAG